MNSITTTERLRMVARGEIDCGICDLNLICETNELDEYTLNKPMNINIPYQTIDWSAIPKTEHKGETGTAFWQTIQLQGLRIRMVEYTANYMADHWCRKGHIVHCLEGEFISESEDGQHSVLTQGMTYVVTDELSSHRSVTKGGVKLLIIDGDFLKYQEEEN